jgi:hypothetical protein
MPSSHDDLLTPTEHEAAQLLVTLAWQLDGGQLASADQCWPDSAPSPPTTSPWRASCCSEKSRTASHRHFSGRRSRSSTTSAPGSPAEQGRPANAAQSRDPSCRAILPAFCPTNLHRAARTRTTLNSQSSWTPADQGEYDSGEPSRTEPDESHPAENRKIRWFDPIPAHCSGAGRLRWVSVRAGSVPQRSSTNVIGHERSPAVAIHRRSSTLQLKQLG